VHALSLATSTRSLGSGFNLPCLLASVLPAASFEALGSVLPGGGFRAIYSDKGATRDDLREAVTTLEDATRTTRRVLGGAHPLVAEIGDSLREARAALHSSEAPP
jgi:hypothetical protein